MKSYLALIFVLMCLHQRPALGQFKTAGIKTHYPAQNASGAYSQRGNDLDVYNMKDIYDKFIPAETYHSGDLVAPATRAPVVLDATAEFINRTRSTIADGICYQEVPTSSLVHGPHGRVLPAGNGTSPDMSRIQVCCEGYERNAHIHRRCDPVCEDDCPNGICTAPNTCVCIPGHVRNYQNKCVSTCPLGCGNGVCGADNVCQCQRGYTLEPLQKQFCIPFCEQGCQNGDCVAPNKCVCKDDYRLTAGGVCEPHCESCLNGRCTAPGICSCDSGYLRVGGVCEPICSQGCKGVQKCVAPDTCQCPEGLDMTPNGGDCVPHCDKPCLNGVCSANNQCVCNSGYQIDELHPNICRPHCPQGCPNGVCSGPNMCLCRAGYLMSSIKGRQVCVPA